MTRANESSVSPATALCKSCGLCCTGHLFVWTKLRSAELESIQALGLKVLREPEQRGFSQPCPLWQGQCTIYDSPHYPRFCHTYKCKLLKEVLDENIPLEKAFTMVDQVKKVIGEVDVLLPPSSNANFRERLIAHVEKLHESDEHSIVEREFLQKAGELLTLYEKYFGVDDLVDQ
jgi:hypothetical protein